MHTLFFLLFLSFRFAYGDAGAGIDPEGGRLRRSGDTGSCIDPYGGCGVRGLGDEGSGSDPHGGRVTGQGDSGPGMDPNGGRVSAQYTACIDPNG